MIGDGDQDVFFNSGEFGHVALLNGRTVKGVFMNGFESVPGPFGSADFESTMPTLLVRSSEVDASALDTESNGGITVEQKSYKAKSIQPDGVGFTLIEMVIA